MSSVRRRTPRRPPPLAAREAAIGAACGAALPPSLFPSGPVADAAFRAARGIAAMLRVAGVRAGVDEVIATWPFVEVAVPVTAAAALDGMELQVANACAARALPATGLHDILRLAYDATRDEETAYRCEAAALVDATLERHGRDPDTPGYSAERASLLASLLADYHRSCLATIDRARGELDVAAHAARWGVLSDAQEEARRLAMAEAHLRALRPAAEPLPACARVIAGLVALAERRGYLYAHARVTVQLRRAYHELRLAGRDGDPAVEASSVLAGKVPDIAPDLCATDDGRRRALAAIDRALACAECPVDGPARYRLAELGTFLERSFFLPPESALLPPLVAAARQAARPLAPIIAAWLTVSDEGEATVVEDSAAASAGDGAGGWAIPLAPRPRARVGGRRARGPPMRGPRRSPPPDRRSGQPGKPDGHPNGEREIEPARALPPRHFSWRKHAG